jgi:hypothetical protein
MGTRESTEEIGLMVKVVEVVFFVELFSENKNDR